MTEKIKFADYITDIAAKNRDEINKKIQDKSTQIKIGIPERIQEGIIEAALKGEARVEFNWLTKKEISCLGEIVMQGFYIDFFIDNDDNLKLIIRWRRKND